MAAICKPRMFYESDPSRLPNGIRVGLETQCASPDLHCTRRGLSSDSWECRSCGGKGGVDNGGGN